MAKAKTQGVEFTDEEFALFDDIAMSSEWFELENRIIDLLIAFPRGRRVIADWLRNEADEVASNNEHDKYARPRELRADMATLCCKFANELANKGE